MGQTLSEPETTKHTSYGEDDRLLFAVSEMQGWRLSESSFCRQLKAKKEAGGQSEHGRQRVASNAERTRRPERRSDIVRYLPGPGARRQERKGKILTKGAFGPQGSQGCCKASRRYQMATVLPGVLLRYLDDTLAASKHPPGPASRKARRDLRSLECSCKATEEALSSPTYGAQICDLSDTPARVSLRPASPGSDKVIWKRVADDDMQLPAPQAWKMRTLLFSTSTTQTTRQQRSAARARKANEAFSLFMTVMAVWAAFNYRSSVAASDIVRISVCFNDRLDCRSLFWRHRTQASSRP